MLLIEKIKNALKKILTAKDEDKEQLIKDFEKEFSDGIDEENEKGKGKGSESNEIRELKDLIKSQSKEFEAVKNALAKEQSEKLEMEKRAAEKVKIEFDKKKADLIAKLKEKGLLPPKNEKEEAKVLKRLEANWEEESADYEAQLAAIDKDAKGKGGEGNKEEGSGKQTKHAYSGSTNDKWIAELDKQLPKN